VKREEEDEECEGDPGRRRDASSSEKTHVGAEQDASAAGAADGGQGQGTFAQPRHCHHAEDVSAHAEHR